MTSSALSKTNAQMAWGGVVSQSWIGLRVTGLSGVVVPPPCLDHPLDNTPPFFSQHAILWFLGWKTLLLSQPSRVLRYHPRKGGPLPFAGSVRSSQPFLSWFNSLTAQRAADAPHPPWSAFCHVHMSKQVAGRFKGYHADPNQSRERMGGRGVSERSPRVALVAEMGSGAISSQSCVYCLDFCNSSPPESVYQ